MESTAPLPEMLTAIVATGVSVTENGCSHDESPSRWPAVS